MLDLEQIKEDAIKSLEKGKPYSWQITQKIHQLVHMCTPEQLCDIGNMVSNEGAYQILQRRKMDGTGTVFDDEPQSATDSETLREEIQIPLY